MEVGALAAREFVLYRGEKFWLQTTGRYFQSGRKDSPERLLHRRVWSDANGPIPEGFEIHHRDSDWRNNDPTNLELVPISKHKRDHMRDRLLNPAALQQNRDWLVLAREAAAKWHGSEVGIEWHKQHGVATWEGREPVNAKCVVCGKKYKTFFPERSDYCSSACAQRVAFRRYFTDTRQCAWCGKEFVANRHRTTACCSRTCSNRKRAADANV